MPLYKLSKSKIIEGIQCPKRLWYSIHHPELAEYSAASTERLQAGLAVHDVFRTLYPDGILVDDEAGLGKALEDTKKLIAVGTPRIFEATFSYQGVLSKCRHA